MLARMQTEMTGNVWRAPDGRLFMQRCPRCNRENWSGAVASGECAWCGEKARPCHVTQRDNNDWPVRDHLPSEVRDDG